MQQDPSHNMPPPDDEEVVQVATSEEREVGPTTPGGLSDTAQAVDPVEEGNAGVEERGLKDPLHTSESKMTDVDPTKVSPEGIEYALSEEELKFSWVALFTNTFPFTATVFLLVITRIEALYIKRGLTSKTPTASVS
eukprot:GHVN01001144.1.p2 GENE.GHVN01001144.1~~GHVN01001144.1.p2  ORF type:complete len:137 (+),score=32.41 GHVN01001144.1:456-866(+)